MPVEGDMNLLPYSRLMVEVTETASPGYEKLVRFLFMDVFQVDKFSLEGVHLR